MSSPASFEIKSNLKLVAESQNLINIVVGYRNNSDFFVLHIDILQHTISLFHSNCLVSSLQHLLSATKLSFQSFTTKHSLLVNRFYAYRVEVKGSKLTLAINGNEVFVYNVEDPSPRGFDGLVGLLCLRGNKLIFKDWQVCAFDKAKDQTAAVPSSSNEPHSTSLSIVASKDAKVLQSPTPSGTLNVIRERLKDLKFDKDIVEAILNDIIVQDIGIKFEDIAALDNWKMPKEFSTKQWCCRS